MTFPLITMARAVIGPEAEPLEGGVPVTLTQVPAVRSWAVPDTVWENLVAEVHVTDDVPVNWLDTVIDEPETDATEPDVAGRLVGDEVVELLEAPDGGVAVALPQAAVSTAREAATTAHPRARRGADGAFAFDNGSCMVPPL